MEVFGVFMRVSNKLLEHLSPAAGPLLSWRPPQLCTGGSRPPASPRSASQNCREPVTNSQQDILFPSPFFLHFHNLQNKIPAPFKSSSILQRSVPPRTYWGPILPDSTVQSTALGAADSPDQPLPSFTVCFCTPSLTPETFCRPPCV